MCRFLKLLAVVLLVCSSGWAHRLVPNDGTHDDATSALNVDDPDLSQLFLQELDAENPELWISFHHKPGGGIYFQLGLPDLPASETYRPSVALLAPGFPAAPGLPFDVPEGYGAMVFDSGDAEPELFEEHFTGTDSLILFEETVTSDEDSVFYLVLYHPDGVPGKAWVALGKREAFGVTDILNFAQTVDTVRTFHEVEDERMPLLTRVLVLVSRFLMLILTTFSI